MPSIINSNKSIGSGYLTTTGRSKQVKGTTDTAPKNIALLGDSTIDNGAWVEPSLPYSQKTQTVLHQTAYALAQNNPSTSYNIANFAVDGATTSDLLGLSPLNKVLMDEDHAYRYVDQISAVTQWAPDVIVLSVAGNNYREALASTLQKKLSKFQLLFRITPEQAKPAIKEAFAEVKSIILKEYKQIIDKLIENNPNLDKLVLLSQYFPELTELTPYFIYTGFSHLARAEGKGQTPFTAVEETMNELYREILTYAANKNKKLVFVDVTSSLNPVGGKQTYQIEPNAQGSKIMGKLIAQAVDYKFPENNTDESNKSVALLRMAADEQTIESQLINHSDINKFEVKKINQFISENRYRHLKLLFSPSSSLTSRYECAYHLVLGKQFDMEYKGLFAFGIMDLSLVTVIASYLWRMTLSEQQPLPLRITAGIVAAPILLTKMVLGLSLLLLLGLPILAYHKTIDLFSKMRIPKDDPVDKHDNEFSYA